MTGLELPLYVETHGPEPGPEVESIVLIHGYGGSSYSWRYWVPHLAKRAHVVLVDMKGFGSAPKPDDNSYSPNDQADLVYRLIQQRDLGRLTLIGHSMGGGVALLTALRLVDGGDDRLRRLVLVAAAAYPQQLPPFVSLARFERLSLSAFRLIGPTRVVRWVLRSIVHDRAQIRESQVQAYAEPLKARDTQRALVRTALQLVPGDIEKTIERFREIATPTLLMWGESDRVVPVWVGERLKAELPNATLHVFGECGHMPAEERPHETWERLEAFLWGIPPEQQSEDETVA